MLGKAFDYMLSKFKTIIEDKNDIAYKIPYHLCEHCYVGETYREVKTKISEHKRAVA